jgi:hypothetical protein
LARSTSYEAIEVIEDIGKGKDIPVADHGGP